MRVNIGGYTTWWGPYQIADLLTKVGVSEDTAYKIGEKLADTWVNDACTWVESKKKRKINIRIDRYDVWSADHTMGLIILPMLKLLKENKYGAPCVSATFTQVSNSAQGSFAFYEEGDDAAYEAGHTEWDIILDKMIWSFEQLLDDSAEDQFWITQPIMDPAKHPEDEGKDMYPVRWLVEGEYDRVGMAEFHKKKQEGFELFGKHFQALWT